jgi:hypothetical protein
MSWSRRFAPGVPDVVFGVVLFMGLAGGRTGFLNDPGTFWHVRLGREIAQRGDVPRHDMLTYTREGVPWVDQSWAFDLVLSGVVDRWGWSAAIAATALGLAALYAMVARGLVREGISPLIAVVVTILVAGIGAIHFLIRPHLLTFAFVWWTFRACRSQHERGGWPVMVVPVLMVPWANVHGGFLAGPLIVLTAGLGHAISGPPDRARGLNLAKFAGTFVLCLLTPLINPYGFGLYRHVAELLYSSGVTSLISEYQPIPFGRADVRVVEWVLLALIALPSFSKARMGRYDLAHTLIWLHLALASVRHAPLFALAVAPGLAKLLDGLPLASRELGRGRTGWSAWPALTTLVILVGVALGLPFGGFDPKTWPLSAVAALDRQPVGARLFHEQDWGGMIEAECQPARPAFVDDRFELFGKDAILKYVDALQGGPEWDALRDREQIELVWVRPDRGLARRLDADPSWQVVHRDDVSVLFHRKPRPATTLTQVDRH